MSDQAAREEDLQRQLRETRSTLDRVLAENRELRALVGQRTTAQLGVADDPNVQAL